MFPVWNTRYGIPGMDYPVWNIRYEIPGMEYAVWRPISLKRLGAVLSNTTVHGSHSLRAAINNHRTLPEDLDLLVEETLRMGNSLCGAR